MEIWCHTLKINFKKYWKRKVKEICQSEKVENMYTVKPLKRETVKVRFIVSKVSLF